MKTCPICGGISGVKSFVMHHQSYDPEIILDMCAKCHGVIHFLARLSPDVRRQVESFVSTYGKNWINCGKKYMRGRAYLDRRKLTERDRARELRRMRGIPERNKNFNRKEYSHKFYLEHRDVLLAKAKNYRLENLDHVKTRAHDAYLRRRDRGYYDNKD